MLMFRSAEDRGVTKTPWLTSYHSFSFNQYYDPSNMGIGSLRVLNDDHVSPGEGFQTHGHQDAEIISYVTQGRMTHKDSMGESYTLNTGDFQVMSAGTGITHSEFNASQTDPMSFIQIWLWPNVRGLKPSWKQQHFEPIKGLQLIAAPVNEVSGDVLPIHQDVRIYRLRLQEGEHLTLTPEGQRFFYLHLIEGGLQLDEHKPVGKKLKSGDGFAQAEQFSLISTQNSEALIFDLHQCSGRRP